MKAEWCGAMAGAFPVLTYSQDTNFRIDIQETLNAAELRVELGDGRSNKVAVLS